MDDFGKILDQWERSQPKGQQKSLPNEFEKEDNSHNTRPQLHPRRWKIDAKLDIHGMTSTEAEETLANFLKSSIEAGYKKILIIHGKGKHSVQDPVLKRLTHDFLDRQPHAGARGEARREQGGSGALWVALKHPEQEKGETQLNAPGK